MARRRLLTNSDGRQDSEPICSSTSTTPLQPAAPEAGSPSGTSKEGDIPMRSPETRHCEWCDNTFQIVPYPSVDKRHRGRFCSPRCSNHFYRLGKQSANWRGGRVVTKSGHVWRHAPGDPHAMPSGYALEHRMVLAKKIGRTLDSFEVVHHLNGDPADNRPDNLALLPSQSVHMTIHNRERRVRTGVCDD